MNDGRKPWIGVDLDGTLAQYHGWVDITHIGEPISENIELVQKLIEAGYEVKIFTARCFEGAKAMEIVQKWAGRNIGIPLEVTNVKDFAMIWLIDDRCIQVEKNTGKILSPREYVDRLFEFAKTFHKPPATVVEPMAVESNDPGAKDVSQIP